MSQDKRKSPCTAATVTEAVTKSTLSIAESGQNVKSPKTPKAAHDLAYLAFMLKCQVNAVRAIHEAMENGSYDPSSFLDGLYAVVNSLWDTQRAISQNVERLFPPAPQKDETP